MARLIGLIVDNSDPCYIVKSEGLIPRPTPCYLGSPVALPTISSVRLQLDSAICFAHTKILFTSMASGTPSDSDFEGVEMLTTPAVPIDPDSFTTSSLHALQSAYQRKVMDIVDKLRRTGLSGIVELRVHRHRISGAT
jgi:hypothetical protein